MQLREPILRTLALAAMLTAGTAAAQYQWRDERGAMTFSDRPPPASVRPADVVRHPAMHGPARGQAERASTPTAPRTTGVREASGGPAGPSAAAASRDATGTASDKSSGAERASTPADRELAFRKRQLDRAQAERKLAESAARLDRQAQACEQARVYQRTLESGMRLAEVDARGEREFVSDQARAQRLDALRRDLQEHCKAG